MKHQINKILKDHVESNTTQINSEKILNFLVQDILDFAQLSVGRFRKNVHNFDLEQAIEEVLSIQEFKAEALGISYDVKYSNFNQLN